MRAPTIDQAPAPLADHRDICIGCGRPLEAKRARLPGLQFHAHRRALRNGGRWITLTATRWKVFEELQFAYPGGVDKWDLAQLVYGAADVEHAVRVKTHVTQLRRLLEQIGLTICRASSGSGLYRLTVAEAPDDRR